ncbi:protein of unknown function (plasmid) [Magnetospirillum sp. XM-1]|uniref:hypothetical protein n=1 Tax=unclassified Magnetospirillum TaxID=2617991 RepID=UPI00073E0956|nr:MULTISPECIES: hypothetical protein [unclassified Magnetospirillum]ARJ66168.1 hypothetical protein WV31_11095 [Magnetospirillum sp. ME-1]CUW42022.1 protein of unknown function [Magnetospirillum sp. XM-1]
MMIWGRLVALVVCTILLPWPTSAREQVSSPIGEQPAAPPRERLASTRALPLSHLLGLCGEVKRLLILDSELGKRPLSPEDIYVVNNAAKCLAATAAIFETIRVMAPMYQEHQVCMPSGVKDEKLLAGLLEWLEVLDREGVDDIFRLSAPRAFILYIRKTYPCEAEE